MCIERETVQTDGQHACKNFSDKDPCPRDDIWGHACDGHQHRSDDADDTQEIPDKNPQKREARESPSRALRLALKNTGTANPQGDQSGHHAGTRAILTAVTNEEEKEEQTETKETISRPIANEPHRPENTAYGNISSPEGNIEGETRTKECT